jgi:hypothetical protein
LNDLVPQFNVRQMSELSFFVKSISTPIRFKIENALIQRFFELLKFEDLDVLRIDSSLELFHVYAHVVHYLDDPQKEEVCIAGVFYNVKNGSSFITSKS